MKKLISTVILAALAATANATVFTYENNGFNAIQGKVKSDLTMSYDDQTDAFSFDLTQYETLNWQGKDKKKDFDFFRIVVSDGPMPVSTDLELWMDWYNNDWTSGYQQGNWLNISDVSSYDVTFGTNNSYSFTTDLTSSLINAGNTGGLYGDTVGVWLWGGKHTSKGTRYYSIFDATNLQTVTANVSEPAPLALLAIAFAGLFMARKRKA